MFADGQPDMTVRGIGNARNAISDQITEARQAGRKQVASVLENVVGQIDSALENVPAYGQARRNFAAASRPLDAFAPGTVGERAVAQDEFGRQFTQPSEQIAPAIVRGGPTAIDQFLAATENSPDARASFARYYSHQMLGAARNAEGRINADILRNVLEQNQDILNRFPEIRARLNDVGAARRALNDLESTPIGALAQTSGPTAQEQFQAQQRLMFNPTNSLAGGHEFLGATVRTIAAKDPEAATSFVRQYLEQRFNEATQSNISGANQFGGPKFAAVVMGNPQQAKNLEAIIRALPDGDVRWNAFRKGMDIMEGMGQRHPVGSQTAFNAQIQKWLEQGNPAGTFVAEGLNPASWPGLARRVYQRVMFDRNTEALARAFAYGDVNDLKALARSGTRSFAGQSALVGLLAREGALTTSTSSQSQQQPP
jgi:hypothetical protein